MRIESMDDLFLEQIEDLYDAENRLLKALPKLAEASSSDKLSEAFRSHLEETKVHLERLEEIFSDLGRKPKGQTCEAMRELIREGEEVLEETDDPSLRDAALIAAASRVEHYEMAAYGSASSFAQTLGVPRVVSLLEATLKEERAADQKLTRIAESGVNEKALSASHVS